MDGLKELRRDLEQLKGRRNQILHSLSEARQSLKSGRQQLRRQEQAREILRAVALETQQQLQVHISDITTLALTAVFPNPYELMVDFVRRRNKTECDLFFSRDKNRIHPLTESGGGAVDVASFALRVASWSMQRPKARNVLILDEPFRYLSTGLLPRAGGMLQQISEKLNLQMIMVTHEEELVENAERVFRCDINQGISNVEEITPTDGAMVKWTST